MHWSQSDQIGLQDTIKWFWGTVISFLTHSESSHRYHFYIWLGILLHPQYSRNVTFSDYNLFLSMYRALSMKQFNNYSKNYLITRLPQNIHDFSDRESTTCKRDEKNMYLFTWRILNKLHFTFLPNYTRIFNEKIKYC